jgi:hypothetical protein
MKLLHVHRSIQVYCLATLIIEPYLDRMASRSKNRVVDDDTNRLFYRYQIRLIGTSFELCLMIYDCHVG